MAVRAAVIFLADPISVTSCHTCGFVATVHPVNRLNADGVDQLPPVTMCQSPDCGVQARG